MDSGWNRSAGGNRGRSPRSGGRIQQRYVPVEAGRHSTNDAPNCKDGTPSNRQESPKQSSPGGISKQSEHELTSGCSYKQDWRSSGNKRLSNVGRNQHGQIPRDAAGSSSQPSGCSSASDLAHGNYFPPLSDLSLRGNTKPLQDESQIQMPIKYGVTNMPSQNKGPQFGKSSLNNTIGTGKIEQSENELTSGHPYKQDWRSSGNKGLPHMGRNQHGQNPQDTAGSSSQPSVSLTASNSAHENYLPPSYDLSLKGNTKPRQDESQIQTSIKYGVANMPSQYKGPQFGKVSLKNTIGTGKIEHSDHAGLVEPFNICSVKTGTSIALKTSLLSKNRERRKEKKRAEEGQKGEVLKPGMVLLKSYISLSDQVRIIKKCQELGQGSGGFYQPGYRDGAKLNLKMMCLGKNWDPETSKYGDERSVDNAKPPPVPDEFFRLVKEAIKESHAFLAKEKITESKVEEIIPWMIPDICIINFYSTSGRLGLHQDRDESPESLHKGLPVISFSIGDSAEFLYSDQRDVANVEKVILESGDVLIFGGKSRHIFHGVGSIVPNTSPKSLLEETNLRPGRLNLTFRQF